MTRVAIALCAVLAMSACGGSRYANGNAGGFRPAPILFASGPIQRACQKSGRKEASLERCGCIQAIADQSMSGSEQRRGARLFEDPHEAQVIRQSDNSRNEKFWLVWKAFGQNAAAACDNT